MKSTTFAQPLSPPRPEQAPQAVQRLAQGYRCWFEQRQKALIAAGLVSLVVSMLVLKLADAYTLRARSLLAAVQARAAELEALEREAIAKADQLALAQKLLKSAAEAGFSERDWDQRRFNMRQVNIGREGLNLLLNDISRARGRLFAAEQFEASVKRPDEGLFSPPSDSRSELMLTLKGTLAFKAKADQ